MGKYANYWLITIAVGLAINVLLFLLVDNTSWPVYSLLNLVFFGGLSWLTFWVVGRALLKQSSDQVVLFVLASLLVDMAAGIAFIFTAVKGFAVEAFPFFVPFGLYYIVFSLLKVVSLLQLSGQIGSSS